MCDAAPPDAAPDARALGQDVAAPSYPSFDDAEDVADQLRRAAEDVRGAGAPVPVEALGRGPVARLAAEADLLLQELHDAHGVQPILVQAPGRISATDAQRVSSAPDDYLMYLRRPLPARPSGSARLGTEFHRWVQDYFTGQTELELDLDSAGAGADPHLAAWQRTFLDSPFAHRVPVLVEESFALHLRVGASSVQVQCKIDAAFETEPGRLLVVDWKTGTPPRTDQDLQLRSIQLQLYRYAVAQGRGIEPETIDACFYYVGVDRQVHGARMSLDELSAKLTVLDPVTFGAATGAEIRGADFPSA